MNLAQIKYFVSGVLRGWFKNKSTLDKISETEDGNIQYDGKEIMSSNIGDLNTLRTENKDNLVSALNEVFQSGCDFKVALSDAITAKDSSVTIQNPENATSDDFVNAINNITLSSSNSNIYGYVNAYSCLVNEAQTANEINQSKTFSLPFSPRMAFVGVQVKISAYSSSSMYTEYAGFYYNDTEPVLLEVEKDYVFTLRAQSSKSSSTITIQPRFCNDNKAIVLNYKVNSSTMYYSLIINSIIAIE